MTVGNSEAEFGEWSPPAADGPWKEPMYREKANPAGTTEIPMVILGRNDGHAEMMNVYVCVYILP